MSIDAIKKQVNRAKEVEIRSAEYCMLEELLAAHDALKEELDVVKNTVSTQDILIEDFERRCDIESQALYNMADEKTKLRDALRLLLERNDALKEENERLKAERDALFTASKCECGADEACRNMVTAIARAEKAEAEVKRMREALEKIEKWFGDFPETGKFWDDEKTRPMSYSACYGSNGERDYMRSVAREALKGKTNGN